MPLSEQEQRLLEEMERSLYQNDADFVATVSPRRGRPNYTIVVVGVLVAVLGIGLLVTGVIIQQPLVGVLGFAVMFVGVLLAVAPPRREAGEPAASSRTTTRSGGGSRFMDTLNDRWDRRQEGRD
ncbi:DUF3040 domain-containing protein [Leifsonia sp. H3M29-4]|uniref:DUF3040 domain-containing protein n=1 Tax=Salinibacterium metalliresistens TaxID=3031321 RepID=UPI0023DAFC90|nr:DUF3040 domain-containing protein [Salinibacterium metalliresistens]MDF1480151.1 DUF3040 domain-containing protein [Salinibacterium metalliresistens]